MRKEENMYSIIDPGRALKREKAVFLFCLCKLLIPNVLQA